VRLRVIDIETSGGQPSEIIEIAAVDVVGCPDEGGWRAEPAVSRLYRPLGEMSVHAMAVHHLTPSALAGCVPCCERELTAFLAALPPADALVAHNAGFERDHIGPHATGGLPWICTLRAARKAWPDAPAYSNQVLRYWRGVALDDPRAMPPHRAAPDAWVTAHLLLDLLAEASIEDLMAWTDAPRTLDRIPFGKHRGTPWAAIPADYLEWLLGRQDLSAEVAEAARKALEARATAAEAAA